MPAYTSENTLSKKDIISIYQILNALYYQGEKQGCGVSPKNPGVMASVILSNDTKACCEAVCAPLLSKWQKRKTGYRHGSGGEVIENGLALQDSCRSFNVMYLHLVSTR